ncbi:iron uptake transporter deferrochelatase/peroxidase subunit [Lichenihabitans sp. Uapishka_5]|uniref:iron uptake transporter deferrochelatase/peroxidase subunit n=1 Tax=Lichenihabitans sp. Uapishka_5 TaxID=3037302 RepID=UPI0029E7F735|nr:iron uptake transporter deferrochelatase/peroxidase subunit [Lichenihabitans sp. Uapishka_5]MDX7950779.1 iron uptake transporter deferrochelatase/peroxidase subunit [Lichenihabitans sp. Uapishka_5]
MLLGLGAAGGAFGLRAEAAPAPTAQQQPAFEDDGTQQVQPFFGPHQPGILTPQPAAALFVAFDVLADTKDDLTRLMTLLTERIAFLMKGGPVERLDRKLPPADSGLMGPAVFPDNLTITVSLGASLFDERFGLAGEKPAHLVPMAQFPNDALDEAACHGDLLVQICSNTAETNIHALRDIVKHTPDLLGLRWQMPGFLPPHTLRKLGRDTVRNLLGFKDGTANLDARDESLMERVVWTGGRGTEPGWTAGGTYQVVRIIRMLVERWDRTPLGEQESIIGRDKMEGAPLGQARERDTPDYAADPHGLNVRLDAHIRLANPRRPDTDASLILRRPFNFSNGLTKAGQLDMGLLFVSFQADLTAGFIAVQNRLNGEPLEEYIKPVGGGYFFTLPGVPAPGRYLAQPLLERTT